MLKIFISYSRKDKEFLDELTAHLATLRNRAMIEPWTDHEIQPGIEWEPEIWTNFRSADIVILLISADFLNSEFAYKREFQAAEQRHHRKEVRLIPVIVRSCDWKDGRLDRLQVLCADKAVRSYGDRDEAWTLVVAEIRRVVAQMQSAADAESADAPRKGDCKRNPQDGQTYVYIPAGKFRMGCSEGDDECYGDEKPAREVTITSGFWLGETAVTVEAYRRFARATGKHASPDRGNAKMPAHVTWDEAKQYCEWTGGRLPTEAEWEYAARGETSGARYGELDEIAWYQGNSANAAHEVGLKAPNVYGLYDMLGNVWEWTADWYAPYPDCAATDPKGPSSGSDRVLRGGAWDGDARGSRVSGRYWFRPSFRDSFIGVRCAWDSP